MSILIPSDKIAQPVTSVDAKSRAAEFCVMKRKIIDSNE